MADSALGLAKTAVEGTVGRVLVAIDEDKKLKAVAQEDLRYIVGELQIMRAFLEEANDNKERTRNKVVKTLVRQLRELALDVEDCVEFVIHMDTTSTRAWWSWVWRVVPLPSSMTPAWVRESDQAVAQLKQLKARVEEVSQRNARYNLLGGEDSGSSTTLPEQLDADAFTRTANILRALWKANMKQSWPSFKSNLADLVTDKWSDQLKVISVWRAEGADLEAADFLNAAFCRPEFEARARMKLMHPFNIQDFLKGLVNQLYVTSPQQDTLCSDLSPAGHNDSVIHKVLRQLLSQHKCLIILEDLTSTVEWNLIKRCLPDSRNGSRIVISTQQLGVALSCTGEPHQVLELAQANDRFIYAFYKLSSCVGTTELLKQIAQRRVVSLWRDEDGDTMRLVREAYDAIQEQSIFEGEITFRDCRWFNASSTLEVVLKGICDRWCHGYDNHKDNPESFLADWSKCNVLVVIEGLQSAGDWDLIKDKLVPENTKNCIVIIANNEEVAKHCEDKRPRNMEEEDDAAINAQIVADNAQDIISELLRKEAQDLYSMYSFGRGRFYTGRFGSHGCSDRMEASLQFAKFIQPDQEYLVRRIFQSIDYDITALWGATGVGKSALIRFCYYTLMVYSSDKIFNMVKETDEFPKMKLPPDYWPWFERFGWVDVSEAFDLAEFSRRLLIDFHSYDRWEMEKIMVGIIQGQDPIQQCQQIMRKHKCLVVIDGLRSTRDWDSIQQALVPNNSSDSTNCNIIVISIDRSIAEHCVVGKETRPFHIRPLQDKSALQLFNQLIKAHGDGRTYGGQWISAKEKLKCSRDIAPRCGGLPKLINAVAQSKDFSLWVQNINDDLVTMFKNDPQFDHLRGVLSWMHSYFDVCSDSIKPCALYLSVFPTNYKIRKARLLRRWIAEGYSRDTTSQSAKENAERLLDDLVKVGIIQKLPNMPFYQINGFFREYIISQPMEDNLVFALERHCKSNSQRVGRHLTIMKSWEREHQNVFESIEVSRLRSLTVYGQWKSFFISDKMKRIRVLDLEGTSGFDDDELRRIFGILLSLKFINLRGCKKIHCLPETLGGLRQLESLDVRGTSIVTLPRAIIKLQKIQYIRAGMFLPCEDWASTAQEDNSDDEVAAQEDNSNDEVAAQEDNSDDEVAAQEDNSDVEVAAQEDNSDDEVAAQEDNNDDEVAAQEDNSDDEVGSEPLGIEPTPQEPAVQDNEAGTTTRPDSGEGQTEQSLQTPRTKGPQASRIPGPALTATPQAGDDSGYQGQHQHHKHKIKKVGRHCTSGLSLRLSPLLPCSWFAHSNNNGGVEVPAGIEDMPALHTLGTVNINCAGGKDFLAKLKDKTKFQQLLKLNVCGINKGNWKDLCVALSSANDHLESLSLGFDEDFTDDSCFNNPPKALKSLRLYGHIPRLPNWTWVYNYMLVVNLRKFDLEVIISSQGDMDKLVDLVSSAYTSRRCLGRLCVKPTQVTRLEFKKLDFDVDVSLQVLKIDCSSALEVSFKQNSVAHYVKVLIIHCSKGSEFRISSEESGINQLDLLDTVWLKGYDRKAEYVVHLMEQIATHPRKPVFKFEKLESA